MASQIPPERIPPDDETLEEAYERTRIDALPPALQTLALAHHEDQFNAVPSLIENQAADFVAWCTAHGIDSLKE
jgi:hypothetical protein